MAIGLNGKTRGIGTNDKTKTSPKFKREYPDGNIGYTRHAEMHLVSKGQWSQIWVFRVRKDGKISMAKPCPACQKFINKYRSKVFFTNWEGKWERLQ